jgi:hypothetical protein
MTEIPNKEILEILKLYINEDQIKKYIDLVKFSSDDKSKLMKRLKKINHMTPINESCSLLRSSSQDSIDLFTPEAMHEIENKKTRFKTDIPVFLDYIKNVIQNLELIHSDFSCGPS